MSKVPAQYCEQTGKVIFDKKGAITAANKRFKEDHVELRAYPCQLGCNGWHLSSQPFRRKERP